MDYYFVDYTEKDIKKGICKRKIINILLFIGNIFLTILFHIGNLLKNIFYHVYVYLYPKRKKIKKTTIICIILYILTAIGINVGFIIAKKDIIPLLFILIPVIIASYIILRIMLWIYHILIGNYQILESKVIETEQYIISPFMPRMQKVFGETGKGKDTYQAGCCSVLSRYFNNKTNEDINNIKDICYIFNFELLDLDLSNNYSYFVSFSKEIIKNNFFEMATRRKFYIKKYYLNNKKLNQTELLNDYDLFNENPIYHKTKYAYGTGVNRKHFLQIILEEYIEWFIRINFEKNFLIVNQPFMEDIDSGLPAKMFSFNFLRTKHQKIKVRNKDGKVVEEIENTFFPWKDRIVLSETECGSWLLITNLFEDNIFTLFAKDNNNKKMLNQIICVD